MKLYYQCSFFHEKWKEKKEFSVSQDELFLNKKIKNRRFSFNKIKVEYKCKWIKQADWKSDRPTIIIPTKDQIKMLSYTCQNLKDNKVNLHCNIIIIDDRSTDDIKTLALNNKFSYLRVDNSKGFNFSMLNNIASKICIELECTEVIFWNSDLWINQEKDLTDIIHKHRTNKSAVSGAKLLYPPEDISFGNKNIDFHFPEMSQRKWRETIQFGGDGWINTANSSPVAFSPYHFKRFSDHLNPLVNCDRGCTFVTGAFQIWDLKIFCDLKGFNPSLSKNFQDVDICLRLLENKQVPMYFGKDIFFFHDESPTLMKEGKNDKQLTNDHILFGKIWNEKLASLIY